MAKQKTSTREEDHANETFQTSKTDPEVSFEEVAAQKCPIGRCKVGEACTGATGTFHDRRIRKAQKQKAKTGQGKPTPPLKLKGVPPADTGTTSGADDGETLVKRKKISQFVVKGRVWVLNHPIYVREGAEVTLGDPAPGSINGLMLLIDGKEASRDIHGEDTPIVAAPGQKLAEPGEKATFRDDLKARGLPTEEDEPARRIPVEEDEEVNPANDPEKKTSKRGKRPKQKTLSGEDATMPEGVAHRTRTSERHIFEALYFRIFLPSEQLEKIKGADLIDQKKYVASHMRLRPTKELEERALELPPPDGVYDRDAADIVVAVRAF